MCSSFIFYSAYINKINNNINNNKLIMENIKQIMVINPDINSEKLYHIIKTFENEYIIKLLTINERNERLITAYIDSPFDITIGYVNETDLTFKNLKSLKIS